MAVGVDFYRREVATSPWRCDNNPPVSSSRHPRNQPDLTGSLCDFSQLWISVTEEDIDATADPLAPKPPAAVRQALTDVGEGEGTVCPRAQVRAHAPRDRRPALVVRRIHVVVHSSSERRRID